MSQAVYTVDEVAVRLHKSRRWLQSWLRENPADAAGMPYYAPAGRTKLFGEADISRIKSALREHERCRLELSPRVPGGAPSITSEERSPDELLMRLRRHETKKVLRDLRLVSK